MYNIFEGDLLRYFAFSLSDGITEITDPSAREIKFEVVSARQRGAAGKLRGEGETQLEIERRIISEKENKIRRELMAQVNHRQNMKIKRRKENSLVPKIALVFH